MLLMITKQIWLVFQGPARALLADLAGNLLPFSFSLYLYLSAVSILATVELIVLWISSIIIQYQMYVNSQKCAILGPDQRNTANAVFCSWMAVGNIFGFSSGASGNWHKWDFLLVYPSFMYAYVYVMIH